MNFYFSAATIYYSLTTLLFSILPFSIGELTPANASNWIFSKEVDGIRVYYRQSESSPVKELKIQFTVEAGLQPVLAVLRDIDAFPLWIYNCSEARLLDGEGSRILYYHRINFPWPLSDRDAVSLATYEQDPESGVVYSMNNAVEGEVPSQNGVVRLREMEIRWVVTPVGGNESSVDYYLRTDPGGSLPSWLINLAIDRGPIKSMQAFRALVSQKEYTDAQVEGITEFY